MAKIGSLEVRTIGKGKDRVKVVKLPGNHLPIEHFFPENHEQLGAERRVTFIRSKIGRNPIFVKKTERNYGSLHLDAFSELKLARHINALGIRGLHAEAPLAAIIHTGTEKQSVIYRKITGNAYSGWARDLEKKLVEHGIIPNDVQYFEHGNTITLIDLEAFKVSDELKKKLKLKYVQNRQNTWRPTQH